MRLAGDQNLQLLMDPLAVSCRRNSGLLTGLFGFRLRTGQQLTNSLIRPVELLLGFVGQPLVLGLGFGTALVGICLTSFDEGCSGHRGLGQLLSSLLAGLVRCLLSLGDNVLSLLPRIGKGDSTTVLRLRLLDSQPLARLLNVRRDRRASCCEFVLALFTYPGGVSFGSLNQTSGLVASSSSNLIRLGQRLGQRYIRLLFSCRRDLVRLEERLIQAGICVDAGLIQDTLRLLVQVRDVLMSARDISVHTLDIDICRIGILLLLDRVLISLPAHLVREILGYFQDLGGATSDVTIKGASVVQLNHGSILPSRVVHRSVGVHSVVVGVIGPVRRTLIQERISTLHSLITHISEPGGLACEKLLAHQSVVDKVEGVLEHALCGR